jgi:hypothetical protein
VPGVGNGAFLAAGAVGIALIALQGFTAWRGTTRVGDSYLASEVVAEPSLDPVE